MKRTRREFIRESTVGGTLSGVTRRRKYRQNQSSPVGVVAHWNFDDNVRDSVGEQEDELLGNHEYLEGLKGKALKLDGFTTRITRKAGFAPSLDKAFSIEGWIALAAYPWNWCSLVSHKHKEQAGYDFAIGPQGEISLSMSMDDVFYRSEWRTCKSESRISLRTWTHVVAVYDPTGLRLYLNGDESGRMDVRGRLVFAEDVELRIGMNDEKKEASHPHRSYSNLPTWFSLDGLLDELKIHDVALTEDQIRKVVASSDYSRQPSLPERRLPGGGSRSQRFGAYYCELSYHKEWDDLWPTGSHPDIVVHFDDSSIRVVFWRGTSYSPAWVTENDLWMTDQSVEGWSERGTFEHMNDPRCLYSHVRILESHEARVVIHWRYAPVNTRGEFWSFDEISGWGCWVDEYHTFYPNGIGVRNVTWQTGSLQKPRQFQETLPLCHPGQRAEDVLELDAVTLANLKGDSYTYSWPGDAESRRTVRPDEPNIEIVHMKSRTQPFYVFEPGTQIQVLGGTPRRGIYSVFPHVNHWPVAMIPSDGRTSMVPDRVSSLSPCISRPITHEESERGSASWLWGMCDGTVADVLRVARYWSVSPKATVTFDRQQHAYVLSAQTAPVEANIDASSESPLEYPAFVVEQWGGASPQVRVNGEILNREEYRTGFRQNLKGNDLIVWVNRTFEKPVRVEVGVK